MGDVGKAVGFPRLTALLSEPQTQNEFAVSRRLGLLKSNVRLPEMSAFDTQCDERVPAYGIISLERIANYLVEPAIAKSQDSDSRAKDGSELRAHTCHQYLLRVKFTHVSRAAVGG